MFCCYILQGFAFDYTDENGVTWSCEINSDGAKLTGASNYGTEVIVPEKVYNGDLDYPTICLSNTFRSDKNITKIILPKTVESCYNLNQVENSNFIK